MVWTVNPKPLGPLRMMMGGLRLVTKGDISRQGEVSRELAVLEPPPPGECIPTAAVWKSSASEYVTALTRNTDMRDLPEGIIRDNPEAEALFTTALDRDLDGGVDVGTWDTRPGDSSLFVS